MTEAGGNAMHPHRKPREGDPHHRGGPVLGRPQLVKRNAEADLTTHETVLVARSMAKSPITKAEEVLTEHNRILAREVTERIRRVVTTRTADREAQGLRPDEEGTGIPTYKDYAKRDQQRRRAEFLAAKAANPDKEIRDLEEKINKLSRKMEDEYRKKGRNPTPLEERETAQQAEKKILKERDRIAELGQHISQGATAAKPADTTVGSAIAETISPEVELGNTDVAALIGVVGSVGALVKEIGDPAGDPDPATIAAKATALAASVTNLASKLTSSLFNDKNGIIAHFGPAADIAPGFAIASSTLNLARTLIELQRIAARMNANGSIGRTTDNQDVKIALKSLGPIDQSEMDRQSGLAVKYLANIGIQTLHFTPLAPWASAASTLVNITASVIDQVHSSAVEDGRAQKVARLTKRVHQNRPGALQELVESDPNIGISLLIVNAQKTPPDQDAVKVLTNFGLAHRQIEHPATEQIRNHILKELGIDAKAKIFSEQLASLGDRIAAYLPTMSPNEKARLIYRLDIVKDIMKNGEKGWEKRAKNIEYARPFDMFRREKTLHEDFKETRVKIMNKVQDEAMREALFNILLSPSQAAAFQKRTEQRAQTRSTQSPLTAQILNMKELDAMNRDQLEAFIGAPMSAGLSRLPSLADDEYAKWLLARHAAPSEVDK